MKKSFVVAAFAAGIFLISCKTKQSEKTKVDEVTRTEAPAGDANTANNNTDAVDAGVAMTALPDTLSFGTDSELSLAIKNVQLTTRKNDDGKITDNTLSYDFEARNNLSIGGQSLYVNPENFRLELDNGSKISHDIYHTVNIRPEATEVSKENKFVFDPNRKPVALHLFYNNERKVVKLNAQ